MARFNPKTLQEIRQDIINAYKVDMNINDVTSTSDLFTVAHSQASAKYQELVEIGDILDLDNLDNLRGAELELRAARDEIFKEPAKASTVSDLEVIDTAITKIDDTVKAGGANTGETFLPVAGSTADFPSTGTLLIGERTESEFEEKAYSSKTIAGFNLDAPLDNDHGAGEPIVLKTLGDRTYGSGYKVKVPQAPNQEKVVFTTTNAFTIYDGEEKATDVSATCDEVGEKGNVSAETITEFDGTKPFATAICTNPTSIENGVEEESDDSLRDRVRNAPDATTKGIRNAIIAAVREAQYGAQRVVYTQAFESSNNCDPSIIYIDDGSGFTPTRVSISEEILLLQAVGGEQYFQIKNFPLTETAREFNITAINTSTRKITIAGDYVSSFPATRRLLIRESTGNDGSYTVASASLVTGNTEIIVNESIPDGTVDGVVYISKLWVYKNNTTLLIEGVDYKINKYTGLLKLIVPLVSLEKLQLGSDALGQYAYEYFTGLLAVAQWKINGIRPELAVTMPDILPLRLGYSLDDFPGATYGNMVEATSALHQAMTVEGELVMKAGKNKDEAIPTVTQNIMSYINTLGIGATVILDQVRLAGLKVKTVDKFNITAINGGSPQDFATQIGYLPRIAATAIGLI